MTARKYHIKLYITLFENICPAHIEAPYSNGALFYCPKKWPLWALEIRVCDFIALGGQITPPRPKRRACGPILIYTAGAKISYKNDYNYMSRIIDDGLYAEIVRILTDDPKVKVFQQLILAPKAEPAEPPAPAENTTESEV